MDPLATLCAALTFGIVFLGVMRLGLPWIQAADAEQTRHDRWNRVNPDA